MSRLFPYSLDDIAKAYEATGLKPIACCYFDPGRDMGRKATCGCPMAVLAVHRSGIAPEKLYVTHVHRILDLSRQEEMAFEDGFDGEAMRLDSDTSEAYAAGQAARERFLPELVTDTV